MSETLRHRRSRGRLALLAALLIVARVAAWEIHAVSAEHAPLHDCAVCLHADRTQDGLPQAFATPPPELAREPVEAARVPAVASAPVPVPAARGPPASLPA